MYLYLKMQVSGLCRSGRSQGPYYSWPVEIIQTLGKPSCTNWVERQVGYINIYKIILLSVMNHVLQFTHHVLSEDKVVNLHTSAVSNSILHVILIFKDTQLTYWDKKLINLKHMLDHREACYAFTWFLRSKTRSLCCITWTKLPVLTVLLNKMEGWV